MAYTQYYLWNFTCKSFDFILSVEDDKPFRTVDLIQQHVCVTLFKVLPACALFEKGRSDNCLFSAAVCAVIKFPTLSCDFDTIILCCCFHFAENCGAFW